jgi:uncharacterized protein (DUF1810 family)
MREDPFNLDRFVAAQTAVFSDVLAELRAGRKRSHWMWFIFPQLKGLGKSWMAEKFGISGREEAAAYLKHPVLGARLTECAEVAASIDGRSAEAIFGEIDALKFRSSMTLFAAIAGDNSVFAAALNKYFNGQPDSLTVAKL